MAGRVGLRLATVRASARTVTLKLRRHDFTTLTRSATLPAPTDSTRVIGDTARSLLAEVDVSDGVRLLGVGVSSLVDWVQDDLFATPSGEHLPDPPAGVGQTLHPGGRDEPTETDGPGTGAAIDGDRAEEPAGTPGPDLVEQRDASAPGAGRTAWPPGGDVVHTEHGAGWVWGSGRGLVTVRFETRHTGPGPVRTFAEDDPDLRAGTVKT